MKSRLWFLSAALACVAVMPTGAQPAVRASVMAASGLQLSDALTHVEAMMSAGQLDIGRIQQDTLIAGRVHERLVQMHQAVPVFGGQVVRQIDGRSPISVFGRVYEGIDIDVTPTIAPEAASAIAARQHGDEAIADQDPELGILPRDDRYTLAYKVKVRSPGDIRIVYVNAKTGAIAFDYSNLQTQAIIGRGTGTLGDAKKVSANQAAGTYRTEDRLRPNINYTFDLKGSFARFNAFLLTGILNFSDIATDSDNIWTDGPTVDSQVYLGWTYDFYFKRFGRRSIDDRNRQLISVVHPLARADASRYDAETRGLFINNAIYFGDGFLLFGDGDGTTFDYLSAGLDVVAHETTHGVTEFTSALNYFGESGALNEAFSDIMGLSAEFYYEPIGTGPQHADWLIGEDVTRYSPGYIRSPQNPTLAGFPDHYSIIYTGAADNQGVHINASIVTHAFYLAVAGGTNRVSNINVQGIGQANLERMERVFYRAFVFLLGPSSQFKDARAATLQAATDLYGAGSNDRAQLAQAWTAVGVN